MPQVFSISRTNEHIGNVDNPLKRLPKVNDISPYACLFKQQARECNTYHKCINYIDLSSL